MLSPSPGPPATWPPKWVHSKAGGLKPQVSGQRTVKGSPRNLEEPGEPRRGKSLENNHEVVESPWALP